MILYKAWTLFQIFVCSQRRLPRKKTHDVHNVNISPVHHYHTHMVFLLNKYTFCILTNLVLDFRNLMFWSGLTNIADLSLLVCYQWRIRKHFAIVIHSAVNFPTWNDLQMNIFNLFENDFIGVGWWVCEIYCSSTAVLFLYTYTCVVSLRFLVYL